VTRDQGVEGLAALTPMETPLRTAPLKPFPLNVDGTGVLKGPSPIVQPPLAGGVAHLRKTTFVSPLIATVFWLGEGTPTSS
jgi:hypothetical protein